MDINRVIRTHTDAKGEFDAIIGIKRVYKQVIGEPIVHLDKEKLEAWKKSLGKGVSVIKDIDTRKPDGVRRHRTPLNRNK